MHCPYCNGTEFTEAIEHPYPYQQLLWDSKINNHIKARSIRKYYCICGYPFFQEYKVKIGWQIYKQGMYILKNS